jgi:hypothetical protein
LLLLVDARLKSNNTGKGIILYVSVANVGFFQANVRWLKETNGEIYLNLPSLLTIPWYHN